MAVDIAHHAVNLLPFKIALIGTLGIGAQWLAWRLQRPAIVLMALAGLLFGPFIGWLQTISMPGHMQSVLEMFRLDPVNDFGDVYRPMIGIAVAIILFEGGLNLRFKDLGDASHAVGRMVFIAAPIAWLLGTGAAHYIIGLQWDLAAMVGGLFVVTGPTVIMPLLRQAHLKSRPANVLKWEGIVNDPLGALFAVGGISVGLPAWIYSGISESPDRIGLGPCDLCSGQYACRRDRASRRYGLGYDNGQYKIRLYGRNASL